MAVNQDFRDLLSIFNDAGVEYLPIHLIGRVDLIRAKRAAGRPQDLLDLERLEGGQ